MWDHFFKNFRLNVYNQLNVSIFKLPEVSGS